MVAHVPDLDSLARILPCPPVAHSVASDCKEKRGEEEKRKERKGTTNEVEGADKFRATTQPCGGDISLNHDIGFTNVFFFFFFLFHFSFRVVFFFSVHFILCCLFSFHFLIIIISSSSSSSSSTQRLQRLSSPRSPHLFCLVTSHGALSHTFCFVFFVFTVKLNHSSLLAKDDDWNDPCMVIATECRYF